MPNERFAVLDGWRGISILVVLACHLLPLGPKPLQLNYDAGLLGMSLFFTLSGFLVTNFLLHKDNVLDFLVRRFFRILPLAWLYIVISLTLFAADLQTWLSHLTLSVDYMPKLFIPHVTDHLWSLCVEIHFYLGIALIVAVFKKNGLYLIPVFCILVTAIRVMDEVQVAFVTHLRIDEILAGGILALIYGEKFGQTIINFIRDQNFWLVLILLVVSCHPKGGAFMFLRPYFAALLIGITLFNPQTKVSKLLNHKFLFYVATISYALYVLHPLLASTWLGSGEGWDKYMKRPILFAVLFICAHVSTLYLEKPCIAFGKSFSNFLNVRFNHAKK
jgi:peptidoglycan/LPS O-acetylase OafA/YrhL